jgi:hypothetical protein
MVLNACCVPGDTLWNATVTVTPDCCLCLCRADRLAMLGWLGVAITEPFADGKGPIGQMAW